MRLPLLALVAFAISGCASANRVSLPPDEAVTVHRIEAPADIAFLTVERSLAECVEAWERVIQLRQPETGTMIARTNFRYSDATGSQFVWTRVTAEIKGRAMTLTYQLGDNRDRLAPSSSGVRQVRDQFRAVSSRVAVAVGGSVVHDSSAPVAADR
jgi:hypothetical protein